MEAPVVSGPRVLLRGWRDNDLEAFARLNEDPEVMKHFPRALSREESDAMVRERIAEHFSEHGFGLWAVEVPGVATFIGFVGLQAPPFEARFTPCVEVGWRLAREHWGHGYATEAGRVALDFGFESVGLEEIVSFAPLVNSRSIAVMQRLGMRPDGTFDHPRLADGHPLRPHVLYRLQRSRHAAQGDSAAPQAMR
ncbi:MAG: GNAT family N-acetyltransferase [Gaiella sp.]